MEYYLPKETGLARNDTEGFLTWRVLACPVANSWNIKTTSITKDAYNLSNGCLLFCEMN
jgi:hypothetical protein